MKQLMTRLYVYVPTFDYFSINTCYPGVDTWTTQKTEKNYAATHKRVREVSISSDTREEDSQSERFARLHNSRLDGRCAFARPADPCYRRECIHTVQRGGL